MAVVDRNSQKLGMCPGTHSDVTHTFIHSTSNYTDEQENPFRSTAVRIFLAFSVLYLYSGLFQLFPIPGWVDAGMYLGYGLNLPSLVHDYGLGWNTYQGARLSYVLPLFFAHKFSYPLLAQYLLVGLFYLSAILSVIWLGFYNFGKSAGYLAAAFLAFNPLFISSITFGGPDGASTAYLMLVAACLFSPWVLHGDVRGLLLAGCFSALAVSSHFYAAVCLAGMYFGYIYLVRITKDCLKYCLWVAVGFIITLMFLGVVGMFFGYKFLFLTYSINMTNEALKGFGANYQLPLKEWIFSSTRVLVPISITLWLIALAMRNIPIEARRLLHTAIIIIGFPLLFYFLWDFVVGGSVIQTRSYFSLLLPCCVIALFGVVSQFRLKNKADVPLLILLFALPTLLIAYFGWEIQKWWGEYTERTVFFILVATSLVLALFLLFLNNVSFLRVCLITMPLVLSSNFAVNADTMKVYKSATGLSYKDAYLGMCYLVTRLKDSGLASGKLKFWFDRESLNQKLGDRSIYFLKVRDSRYRLNYYDSLVSLYLWDQSLFSAEFPKFSLADLKEQQLPMRLVILGENKHELAQAIPILQREGYHVAELTSFAYDKPEFGWYVSIVDVQ